MLSGSTAVVLPSTDLVGSAGGAFESLSPLVLDLEGEAAVSLEQADVDGDAVADLLVVRGDGSFATRQGSVVFGDALSPIVLSDSTVPVNDLNFAAGDFVDIRSGGEGSIQDPVRLRGVGDLDGDGLDEVVFSQLQDASFTPGAIYIIRGSALTGAASGTFDIDALTSTDGLQILPVPSLFTSLSSEVSAAPDIDGDGIDELYITSNLRLANDPAGRALILKSTDITTALGDGAATIDLESLFFDESP